MSKCWSRRRVAAWFVSSHDPEALHRPPRRAVRVPISSRGTAAVHDFRLWPLCDINDGCARVRFRGESGLVLLVLSFSGCDPSETCAALDFCSAHWALSPVSLLAIFCFDDGS